MRGERWFEWLKEESADDRDGLPESEELAADALADRSRSGGYGMSEDDHANRVRMRTAQPG